MNQKFSVLMSCYKNDNPGHLNTAIESIFNSSVLPDQFVIVIDGPISIEIELVLESCVKKFPVIELQKLTENHGLGYALNFGLEFFLLRRFTSAFSIFLPSSIVGLSKTLSMTSSSKTYSSNLCNSPVLIC